MEEDGANEVKKFMRDWAALIQGAGIATPPFVLATPPRMVRPHPPDWCGHTLRQTNKEAERKEYHNIKPIFIIFIMYVVDKRELSFFCCHLATLTCLSASCRELK